MILSKPLKELHTTTSTRSVLRWRRATSSQPYGERIQNQAASSNKTRWYTGHAQDAETGLIYAGARYYDPIVGRFMAVDPKGFSESNLQSFNRYAYGNNNPYRYVDPDGKVALPIIVDVIFIGGAVILATHPELRQQVGQSDLVPELNSSVRESGGLRG